MSPARSTHDHDATLTFSYDDERRARIVGESVAVEQGEIADERTRALIEREGATVRVRVSATDLVALRAGCNSWARLVAVAERLT